MVLAARPELVALGGAVVREHRFAQEVDPVDHGDVHELALAGPPRVMDPGDDAERHESAGEQIADGGAAGIAAGAVGAVDVGETAHRLRHDVEGGPVGVGTLAGPGIAEAAKRRVDDPGVALPDDFVAQPKPVHDAGAHVLEHRVGVFAQAEEGLAVGFVLEVERDAALVAVDAAEVTAVVAASVDARLALGGVDEVLGNRRRRPRHVAGRRLDLDHVGAEVGEDRRAEGPGEGHRAVDDCEVAEGACAHDDTQWERRLMRTSRSPSKTIVPSCFTPQCLKRTMPASSRSASRVSSTSV